VLASFPYPFNENDTKEHMDYIYEGMYWFASLSSEAYIKSFSLFNKRTCEIAADEKLPYVDLYSVLNDAGYFQDEIHINDKGQELAAEEYAKVLIKTINKI